MAWPERIRRTIAGGTIAMGVVGPIPPAAAAGDGLTAQFERQWEEAAAIEGLPQGIYLELTFETMQVIGDRGQTETPLPRRVRLWKWDADLWRLSEDRQSEPIREVDAGWSGGDNAAWRMAGSQLSIVDPDRPEEGHNPAALIHHFDPMWPMWTTGLAASTPLEYAPYRAAQARGEGWSAQTRSKDGAIELVYWGDVTSDGRLLVREWKARTLNSDETPIGSCTLGAWRREPRSPSGWIAGVVERFDGTGRLIDRVTIHSIGAADREHVESLADVPPIDGEDPIRGEVTVSSVYDLRPGRRSVSGDASLALLPESDKTGLSIRIAGWLLLGALVMGFFYVRLRKSQGDP